MASAETHRHPFGERGHRFGVAQICGPFHSGTSLVYRYLDAAFRVRVTFDTHFWKHSLPPDFRRKSHQGPREPLRVTAEMLEETLFLCMARLPYFWILSNLRHTYPWIEILTEDPSFGARLRSGLRFRDRLYPDLVELWNAYYRAYRRELAGRAAVRFVRLEDLVQAPVPTLRVLARHLHLQPDADLRALAEEISNAPAKVHGGPCVHGEEARREYVPERVPSRIGAEDLAFINARLDPELMRFFDYPFVG